jgi:4'-phosphopantetheinyl transferase
MTAEQHGGWTTPQCWPFLGPGAVHVWLIALDVWLGAPADPWELLGEDERGRALRHREQCERRRFVIAHAALRSILARYLQADPRDVRYQVAEEGKPALERPAHRPLHFNLAHSHNLALCAVARDREVGVDIERAEPHGADAQVVAQLFSPGERCELLAMEEAARNEGFFRCWTRKEAYVKATGSGISLALHSFDVPLGPAEPGVVLPVRHGSRMGREWTLRDLGLPPGYVGAVAAAGSTWNVVRRQS